MEQKPSAIDKVFSAESWLADSEVLRVDESGHGLNFIRFKDGSVAVRDDHDNPINTPLNGYDVIQDLKYAGLVDDVPVWAYKACNYATRNTPEQGYFNVYGEQIYELQNLKKEDGQRFLQTVDSSFYMSQFKPDVGTVQPCRGCPQRPDGTPITGVNFLLLQQLMAANPDWCPVFATKDDLRVLSSEIGREVIPYPGVECVSIADRTLSSGKIVSSEVYNLSDTTLPDIAPAFFKELNSLLKPERWSSRDNNMLRSWVVVKSGEVLDGVVEILGRSLDNASNENLRKMLNSAISSTIGSLSGQRMFISTDGGFGLEYPVIYCAGKELDRQNRISAGDCSLYGDERCRDVVKEYRDFQQKEKSERHSLAHVQVKGEGQGKGLR